MKPALEYAYLFVSTLFAGIGITLAFFTYAQLQFNVDASRNTAASRVQIPVEIAEIRPAENIIVFMAPTLPTPNTTLSARVTSGTKYESRKPLIQNNVITGLTPATPLTLSDLVPGLRGLARINANTQGELLLQLLVVDDPLISAPY